MVASVVFVNILLINCFQFFFLCKNLILWNTQNFTKVTQPLVSKPTGPLKTYSQSSIIDIRGFEYLQLVTEGLTWLLDFGGFGTMLNTSLDIFRFNSSLIVFCFLRYSFWGLFRPGQRPENRGPRSSK